MPHLKPCQAFAFLMDSDDSRYIQFVQRHRKFLAEHPEADEARRKRPLQFIEELGVESALWPNLYWDVRLCETAARLADVRRQGPSSSSQGPMELDEEEAEAEEGEEASGRTSLKRSFLAKAFGPIADYAGNYELTQFVFDLSVWSDIGGKKGALQGTPMWQSLKGAAWTPQFWKVRHAAALDMQAQCGFPIAFLTWAPFEWSAPYNKWLLQQMEQLGRRRLQLAGPEALHLAHVLTELFREWVCGGGRKFGDASAAWRSAICSGFERADGTRGKINFVGRLEFQDGKRKEASQSYHVVRFIYMASSLQKAWRLCSWRASSHPPSLPRAARYGAMCWTVKLVARAALGLSTQGTTCAIQRPTNCTCTTRLWIAAWASAAISQRSWTCLNATKTSKWAAGRA